MCNPVSIPCRCQESWPSGGPVGNDILQSSGCMCYLFRAGLNVNLVYRCRVKLRWPKAQGEAYRGRTGNAAMLRAWLADAAPSIASSVTLDTAVQVLVGGLCPACLTAGHVACFQASAQAMHGRRKLIQLPSAVIIDQVFCRMRWTKAAGLSFLPLQADTEQLDAELQTLMSPMGTRSQGLCLCLPWCQSTRAFS